MMTFRLPIACLRAQNMGRTTLHFSVDNMHMTAYIFDSCFDKQNAEKKVANDGRAGLGGLLRILVSLLESGVLIF